MNADKSNIERIILNFLEGSASERELEILRKWIDEDSSRQAELTRLCDLWQAATISRAPIRYDAKKAWQEMLRDKSIKPPKPSDNKVYFTLLKVAAIIILVLLSGYLTYHFSYLSKSNEFASDQSYYVPYGSKSHIRLPDGTMVWLNAGSTLSYNRNLGKDYRDVRLEGEAYFNVTKNTQSPFRVEAKGVIIHVVGTSFNVKAYLEEDYVETTVEVGIVKVIPIQNSKDENGAILLMAKQRVKVPSISISGEGSSGGEKLIEPKVYDPLNESISVSSNVDTELYTSWKEYRWIIRSEKLEDLAIQIERRYNVEIFFRDPEIRNYIFSGVLKDENLEQVLRIIASTSPIEYYMVNQSVYLSNKK